MRIMLSSPKSTWPSAGQPGTIATLPRPSARVSTPAPAAQQLALPRCPVSGCGMAAVGRQPPDSADTVSQAMEILRQLQTERGEHGPDKDRINEVCAQIEATGTYRQTEDELSWGAKLAWRN